MEGERPRMGRGRGRGRVILHQYTPPPSTEPQVPFDFSSFEEDYERSNNRPKPSSSVASTWGSATGGSATEGSSECGSMSDRGEKWNPHKVYCPPRGASRPGAQSLKETKTEEETPPPVPEEVVKEIALCGNFFKVESPQEPGQLVTTFVNQRIDRYLGWMRLLEIDGKFYDVNSEVSIKQDGVEVKLWPGYDTSVGMNGESRLLRVDLTHMVVHSETVLQRINNIKSKREIGKNLAVKAELKGAIVMTTQDIYKTYCVVDVVFEMNPKGRFQRGNGERISYVEYYEAMGLEITDLEQPLLYCKAKTHDDGYLGWGKGEFLIPELCHCTGITSEMRAVPGLMDKLKTHLKPGPQDTATEIQNFMTRLMEKDNVKNQMPLDGIRISPMMISVQGRILPSESVYFANNAIRQVDAKGEFPPIDLKTHKILSPVALDKWALVTPKGVRDRDLDKLILTMCQTATILGMRIEKPTKIIMENDRMEEYRWQLEELSKNASAFQMVVVVLSEKRRATDLYREVTKCLTLKAGIPNQCFQAKHLVSRELVARASEMVRKINVKLGGELWALNFPLRNAMVVGVDVYQGVCGNVCAMVSSFSSRHTKYFSTTSSSQSADQFSTKMREDMMKCLVAYKEENCGNLPNLIIMYRDGWSDTHSIELAHIRWLQEELAGLYSTEKAEPPKLTYILVSKESNTRLFAKTDTAGQYENPPPGTVVNRAITLATNLEFYMVSGATEVGETATPVLYTVLLNDSNFDRQRIEKITYKLCHLNYKYWETASVPAPLEYARKLATLTGKVLNGNGVNNNLNKILHFL